MFSSPPMSDHDKIGISVRNLRIACLRAAVMYRVRRGPLKSATVSPYPFAADARISWGVLSGGGCTGS